MVLTMMQIDQYVALLRARLTAASKRHRNHRCTGNEQMFRYLPIGVGTGRRHTVMVPSSTLGLPPRPNCRGNADENFDVKQNQINTQFDSKCFAGKPKLDETRGGPNEGFSNAETSYGVRHECGDENSQKPEADEALNQENSFKSEHQEPNPEDAEMEEDLECDESDEEEDDEHEAIGSDACKTTTNVQGADSEHIAIKESEDGLEDESSDEEYDDDEEDEFEDSGELQGEESHEESEYDSEEEFSDEEESDDEELEQEEDSDEEMGPWGLSEKEVWEPLFVKRQEVRRSFALQLAADDSSEAISAWVDSWGHEGTLERLFDNNRCRKGQTPRPSPRPTSWEYYSSLFNVEDSLEALILTTPLSPASPVASRQEPEKSDYSVADEAKASPVEAPITLGDAFHRRCLSAFASLCNSQVRPIGAVL